MNASCSKNPYFHTCLIYNANQIVQVVSNGQDYIRGSSDLAKNNLAILNSLENDLLVIVSIE